jgi:hypothetical protein
MALRDTTTDLNKLQKSANYLLIPQAAGSSGGHIGTGKALVLAAAILVWADAEATWVEAAAPVRARTTTKARMMNFMELLQLIWFESLNLADVELVNKRRSFTC